MRASLDPPRGRTGRVTILCNDLRVDRAPTPDDTDSADSTLHVQQREQLSDGGDIVGFRLLGNLPEHHPTGAGPVAEQMHRPKSSMTSPQSIARVFQQGKIPSKGTVEEQFPHRYSFTG